MAEVGHWLEELGLGEYAQAFAENDVDSETLSHLTSDDLREIGVVSVGHRRKLLAAIETLRTDSLVTPPAPAVDAQPPQPLLSSEGERRQLTVMFCDLVGSTALSSRLDPEDYREVIRGYQDACAGVIARYDGYVAKFMGDGVLAYYGWPRGHENDAERAISAGLGVIEAVSDIAPADGKTKTLAVRIGVATGPVVVGDIVGEGAAQEAAVTGETPNLAARLQEIAEPNTVAIAATTHALAGGLFAYQSLGSQSLKGIEGATEVWQVVGERRVESRFSASHTTALTPLIGRDEELALLSRRWESAKGGDGQVVLLSGEPGIGKSRLTRALQDWIGDEPHTRLLYQCSPHHTNSALYPIINQIEHVAKFEPGETANAKLDKLETLLAPAGQHPSEILPLMAALLSIPGGERYPLPDLTPQQLKDRLLNLLNAQLTGLAAQQPVLMLYEDVHWIDPTSLELLELAVPLIERLPVLAVFTYRPEFQSPWTGAPHVSLQALNRLTTRDCAEMTKLLSRGSDLPAEILAQLVEKTDGVPLFVEELTRSVLDARANINTGDGEAGAGQSPDIVVPPTLKDALEARLDRSSAVREVAQVGAAIGREFAYNLLAHVVSLSTADLDAALDELIDSGLLFARGAPPDASYTFKHALVQDAAYESLLRSRRQELHRRLAEELLELFPGSAETEPEILAHHFTEAGLTRSAIDYWHRAGQRAAERSANGEAISHLNRALTLLLTLPESAERNNEELDLQIALTGPMTGFMGYTAPETERVYTRALELSEQVGDSPKVFPVLFGWFSFYIGLGKASQCLEFAEDFLNRAERLNDDTFRMIGHRLVGSATYMTGKLTPAIGHLDQAIAMYDVDRHRHLALTYAHDVKVAALCQRSLALWLLGYPDRARASAQEALDLAATLSHATTIGYAQMFGGVYLQSLCRDDNRFRDFAKAVVAVSEESKMPTWAIAGRWAMASNKTGAIDLAELQRAFAALESIRWGLFLPLMLGQYAEALGRAGNQQEAMAVLERGRAIMYESGQIFAEPESYRIEGNLLMAGDSTDQARAEECFFRAIETARQQEAKSWELRAATYLARLWRDLGKGKEARDLLAPVYDWFTEGFDTPDLQDAKALLDELS